MALSLLVPNHLFGQAAPGPIPGKEAAPGQTLKIPNDLSKEFRDVAGDSFDRVLALQDVELKGKLFYEPILCEAELAVHKVQRAAVILCGGKSCVV